MKFGGRRRWVLPLSLLGVIGVIAVVLAIGLPMLKKKAPPPPHAMRTVAPAPSAHVLQMAPATRLLARADRIVVAKVATVVPRWEGRRIVSDVEVEVEDTIKGDAQKTLTLTVAGGTVDGIGMRVSEAPEFRQNERALLFLQRVASGTGGHRVVEMDNGKVPIVVGADGEETILWHAPVGVARQPLRSIVGDLKFRARAQ